MIVKIVLWFLKKSSLSFKERNMLIAGVLGELIALPIRDIITEDESSGVIFLHGRPLSEYEKAHQLRDAARVALSNPALKLVWDQTLYTALKIGVAQGDSVEKIMFSKSAIWNGENERNLLRILAQEGTVGFE